MTTKEILTQAVTAKNAINSADTETKNKALANMWKQQEERFLMS